MTGRQGTPRPATSTFIELRPRTRHTISVPPLSLASTVSDSPKALGAPITPIVTPLVPHHAHTSHPHTHPTPTRPPTPAQLTPTITALRTIQKSSDPSFVCTICWSPQYLPSTPRVLGRSSRIVCHQCWRAVLDLSICWVCGECIVRGDEVVSLGWCFWHRGCFGCLLCGVRLGERVLKECESECENGRGRYGNNGEEACGDRRKGTELDKIPLCEWCETETKIKGYGEKKVLERGLENVTKSDGGLTRCRLEKLDEDKGLGRNSNLNLNGKKDFVVGLDGEEREETGPSPTSPSSSVSPTSMTDKSSKSSTMNERKIRKIIRDSSTPQEEVALLSDAAKMGVSEDGNPDDSTHSHSDTEPAHFGQADPSTSSSSTSSPPSDIYVSIYDPAGQAFVPSKTKPLPKWMSLLPNNVHREREETEGDTSQKKSQAAVSRAKLPEAYADGASSSHSDDCQGDHGPFTSCPTEEGLTGVFPREHSGQVTPKERSILRYLTLPDRLSFRERANSASESTSDSTRRPSASTLSSLALPSPHQKACKTTRPRSVSIEEKLPRPHQHPASAYRRANRSSTIESACIKPKGLVRIIPHPEHTPRDVSERPLTPYPKIDSPDPFQTQHISSSSSTPHPNSKPTLLHSPLSNFITPRKGSCCGLSTSLESASVGEIKRRERGESSFDSVFESFPRPEIGKNNSNYASSLCRSPKLGFLEKGNEYLEYMSGVILPGGGREGDAGKEGGKEGIVEKIRRQRVGTVSLGQVAQNVKEEKERKRAETQIQTEWNWLDHESKTHTPNAIVEQDANAQVGSGRSSRRNRGVSEDEVGRLSRDGSRMSGRRRRGTSGEERGQASRVGSRKEREREREREKIERDRLEKGDSKGKGKEKLVEKEESRIKVEDDVGGGVDESREQLKRELKGLFGEE
ncbi:uncharacterized protein EAE98_001766 [Botrytis deweyae]|uniref:LIM zinc-binding domain-containing protein n=1 Tax=Botrytis deweyae TaxID=2478750 RepID=A0ABQ7IZA1_9HELO|nr:uncharacterized protein EAE98_001766 [Botrytis deweyae]KAF7937452.1 hypothetical protein EAE98_001766 [Botrytis deweyae]